MKIQYASDLHLEFEQHQRFIELGGIVPMGDVLVLRGPEGMETDVLGLVCGAFPGDVRGAGESRILWRVRYWPDDGRL